MFARLISLLAFAVVVFVPAAQSASSVTPSGLRAFLLRVDDFPGKTTFPRTPAFAWEPYDGAVSYDFQLATSRKMDDRTIVWSTDGRAKPLRVPAVTIPVALPWMTGRPYALYIRVRAHTPTGVTRWSSPWGFNMQWTGDGKPEKLPDGPGLVRWTPVEGANSYQVWFEPQTPPGKLVWTTANVADERDYYPSAEGQAPVFNTPFVNWRVRAVRTLYGAMPNGLPAVSYGPWSATYVSTLWPVSAGWLMPVQTASEILTDNTSVLPHYLTPGYSFQGNTATNGAAGQLFRVYVATDRQCVNGVFTGAVVGSPGYAPRTVIAGPPDAGIESGKAADGEPVKPTEASAASGASPGAAAATTTGAGTSAIPPEFAPTGPSVDLWDLGRANARYWWTVVPVATSAAPSSTTTSTTSGTSTSTGSGTSTAPPSTGTGSGTTSTAPPSSGTGTTSASSAYLDLQSPQDACEANRVMQFAKATAPVVTSTTRAYVSGLSPRGDLVAAQTMQPSFYRAPVVAWEPVPGATAYEVQWSKTRAPWRPASTTPLYTAGTSALLEDLLPGKWYYRIRGIDPYMPGPIKQMTWSPPQPLTLTKPRFLIEPGSVITRRVRR
jgi:hypothetical protein